MKKIIKTTNTGDKMFPESKYSYTIDEDINDREKLDGILDGAVFMTIQLSMLKKPEHATFYKSKEYFKWKPRYPYGHFMRYKRDQFVVINMHRKRLHRIIDGCFRVDFMTCYGAKSIKVIAMRLTLDDEIWLRNYLNNRNMPPGCACVTLVTDLINHD